MTEGAGLSTATANLAANALLVALALVVLFFLVRHEIWARVFLTRVDPRPAGLLRIAFGLVVLWTWLGLGPHLRLLFTDEGLWLTEQARQRFGGPLGYSWDPEHGFEHWWKIIEALLGNFSVLHLRSDPPFVTALYAAALLSLTLMVLGVWTRLSTVASWLLLRQLYGYGTIFYNGGDFVVQVFLFLGMFCRWGEAYSIDSRRRRRRPVAERHTSALPAPRPIPGWPLRLMMLQLAIIYCATGLLKSGPTWREGTALYYALNLDHFYRVPAQGLVTWLQLLGVLPLLTWLTRAWEVFFPLAVLGVVVRGYEADRRLGRWISPPRWRRALSWVAAATAWCLTAYAVGLAWSGRPGATRWVVTGGIAVTPVLAGLLAALARRRWPRAFQAVLRRLLGKGLWLGFGVALHLGINAGVNVGTFAEVMLAVYLAWLTASELAAVRRFLLSRPCGPGEGGRPLRAGLARWLLGPPDRLRFRAAGPTAIVRYRPDRRGIRQAATLRLWDSARHLRFAADPTLLPEVLDVEIYEAGGRGAGGRLTGRAAVGSLASVLPGLSWLRPLSRMPGLARPAQRLALRLLGAAR